MTLISLEKQWEMNMSSASLTTKNIAYIITNEEEED